ncbi:MAG: hypothetical protein IPK33_00005 [Gemmatimonadetes bacterium]|nr:hypothetical protein [Gemmatimonadota bacterium]
MSSATTAPSRSTSRTASRRGPSTRKLALNAREAVELGSKSKAAMELWMDGKLIARAIKEKRKCKDVRGNASVTVTPLEVSTDERTRPNYAYGMPYPFYDPWGFSHFYGYGSVRLSPPTHAGRATRS